MKCTYACGTPEHGLARRQFVGGMLGAVGGLGWLTRAGVADELVKNQKRVICINMAGGLSQLESWDPKPGTPTGGPFRAIPTSVTGLHISELLPHTARQMHRLALVRSVNTAKEAEDDHGKGAYLMTTGRRQQPGSEYPVLGAVMAKTLSPENSPLPGHVQIYPWGGGGRTNDAAYLGPKYASVALGNGQPPQYSNPPAGRDAKMDEERDQMRRRLDARFAQRRRTAFTDAYTQNYDQARLLMERRQVFDLTKEPAKDFERYGKHDFGRHCLLARRLVEHGIPFVQVTHSNYDTHNENFDFHLEQVGEFDQPFATLVADLADRGLLDHTLIVVMSEFGRTPNINLYYGRDHWSAAWSVVVGGAKIKRGVVLGKTNPNGTAVVERQVNGANLFHTYLQAVGVDSTESIDVDGRQIPLADPADGAIAELLS